MSSSRMIDSSVLYVTRSTTVTSPSGYGERVAITIAVQAIGVAYVFNMRVTLTSRAHRSIGLAGESLSPVKMKP